MDIVSIFISIARKSGVFVLVLTVLALIARFEPNQEPEPKHVAPMAKVIKKPRPAPPVGAEPSEWLKGPGWRRNG